MTPGTSLIPTYTDDHLAVDFQQHFVSLDNQRMVLTRKEYELLTLMVQHAGEIIPREALLWKVWGYRSDIRTRTLDVHIRRLRKKLGVYADPYIETIFGVGYRFQRFREPKSFERPPQPAASAPGPKTYYDGMLRRSSYAGRANLA